MTADDDDEGIRQRTSALGEHTRAYLKETGFSDDVIVGFAGISAKAARG